MSEHTQSDIEILMKSAMESMREMLDVNMVIGDMIQTADGTAMIPISKIRCGFVAGGGEYGMKEPKVESSFIDWPFAGGSGGGFCVQPVGFLIVNNQQVRLLPVEDSLPLERLVDAAPNLITQMQTILHKNKKVTGQTPDLDTIKPSDTIITPE